METRHIVIDMQRMFAEETPWQAPAVSDILPNVLKLCEAFGGRNLFAKFMLPRTPAAAAGAWQAYYRRWSAMTTEHIQPEMQDLVSVLQAIGTPDAIIEKTTYSIFQTPGFAERLKSDGVERLIFSGVETDVCVLASVFDAVDAGYHVVIAVDAVCSGSVDAHNAVLSTVLSRLPEQITLVETADLL
jgi:nicotinamidase-related amidase